MELKNKKIPKWVRIIHEIFRYLTSGGIGVISDVLILYCLVECTDLYLLYSVSIAAIASTVINYIIQKLWTFRSHTAIYKSFTKYSLVFIFNYFFTIAFMYITVEVKGFYYLYMKIASYIFITAWTYFLYKYFVYKK
jgi:putative flippase GtrA